MSDLRIVIDTNVVVSAALLSDSVPRQCFDLAIARGTILISSASVAELNEVLGRPKFKHYITEPERLEFLAALILPAEQVDISEKISACRDPDDDKYLELAVNGQASHIITGDKDLLIHHPFRGIAILTPQAFLDSLAD